MPFILYRTLLVFILCNISLLVDTSRNFEYEYSLLSGYALLFFYPWLSNLKESFSRTAINSGKEALFVFLIAPFTIILTGALVYLFGYCQCSERSYYYWTAANTFSLWFLSYLLAYLYRAWAGQFKRLIAMHSSLVFIYLLHLLLVFFLFPQKRHLGIASGYLHGPIYDYYIALSESIVKYQVIVFAYFAASAIYVVVAKPSTRIWGKRLLFGCILMQMAIYLDNSLGVGADRLKNHLQEEIVGDGFSLYYRISKPEDHESYRRLSQEAQFHLSDLRSIMGGDTAPHVDIYVYPNSKEKKLYFGGGSTDVADVHTPSIHIDIERIPHSSLRHELVHALASKTAFFGLGVHPNMALTEGLANALAPRKRTISTDTAAGYLVTENKVGNLENIFSPLFWLNSGAASYTLAESYVNFLISRYGAANVLKLYAGESWKKAIPETEAMVIKAWKEYVTRQYDAKAYEIYASAIYKSRGVFYDACPHTKSIYGRASQSRWDLFRRPKGWDPEKDYWLWRLRLDPGDKTAKYIKLKMDLHSKVKETEDTFRLSDFAAILELKKQEFSWPPKTIEDAWFKILIGDVYLLFGRDAEFAQAVNDLETVLREKFLGVEIKKSLWLRSHILEAGQGAAGLWAKYLLGIENKPPQIESDTLSSYIATKKSSNYFQNLNPDEMTHLVISDSWPDWYKEEQYLLLGKAALNKNQARLAWQFFDKSEFFSEGSSPSYYSWIKSLAINLRDSTEEPP